MGVRTFSLSPEQSTTQRAPRSTGTGIYYAAVEQMCFTYVGIKHLLYFRKEVLDEQKATFYVYIRNKKPLGQPIVDRNYN